MAWTDPTRALRHRFAPTTHVPEYMGDGLLFCGLVKHGHSGDIGVGIVWFALHTL